MLDALTEPGCSADGARAEAGTTEGKGRVAATGVGDPGAAASPRAGATDGADGAPQDAATATKPKTSASARGRIAANRTRPSTLAAQGSFVAPTRILPA